MAENQKERRDALLRQLRTTALAVQESGHDRMPPERKLAADLGISRGLLRSLLTELEGAGLLRRRNQSGWLLARRSLSEPNNSVIGFSEMGRMYGYEAGSRVLGSVVRQATESELLRLRLAPLSRVWVLTRARSLDQRPVSLEEVVIPFVRARELQVLDMTDRSLFAELHSLGTVVSRVDVSIEARTASSAACEVLGLEPGSPVLSQRELAFDQFGGELYLCRATYRADSYSFRTTLTRRGQANLGAGVD